MGRSWRPSSSNRNSQLLVLRAPVGFWDCSSWVHDILYPSLAMAYVLPHVKTMHVTGRSRIVEAQIPPSVWYLDRTFQSWSYVGHGSDWYKIALTHIRHTAGDTTVLVRLPEYRCAKCEQGSTAAELDQRAVELLNTCISQDLESGRLYSCRVAGPLRLIPVESHDGAKPLLRETRNMFLAQGSPAITFGSIM